MTVDDVLANPGKFGVPTFEEFSKNPAKYRDSVQARLGRIDKSSVTLNGLIEKQTYKVAGYECKTLEEAERIAKNEGIDLMRCKLCPQIVQGSMAGKYRIIVELKMPTYSRIMDQFGKFFRR